MKVLLRHTQTGLFYAGSDHWTDDHSEAVDFEATDRALDHVSEAKLQAMEVLMRFDDPHFEIPLTIAGLGG
jgi:hypothetical protein